MACGAVQAVERPGGFLCPGAPSLSLFTPSLLSPQAVPPAPVRLQAALAAFQKGHAELAELDLRALIRRYPRLAEAHAALAAVLCRRGAIGKAGACWREADRLDPRCCQHQWLQESRQWPPLALEALEPLLARECLTELAL